MEITLDIFRNSQIMQRNLIFRYENKSKSQQIIENIKKLIFKNIYSKESFEFRNMYYKTLEYFKNKYSTDIFSEKILEMYKIKLLKSLKNYINFLRNLWIYITFYMKMEKLSKNLMG